jgi:hypothetical protein
VRGARILFAAHAALDSGTPSRPHRRRHQWVALGVADYDGVSLTLAAEASGRDGTVDHSCERGVEVASPHAEVIDGNVRDVRSLPHIGHNRHRCVRLNPLALPPILPTHVSGDEVA